MTERRNIAASVRQRLLDTSRARREDFQVTLTRYALERLLYRLSKSAHRDQFIIKGAMLFSAWNEVPHRPTRDLDLLSFGTSDVSRLEGVFREIVNTEVEPDGLELFAESVCGARITRVHKKENRSVLSTLSQDTVKRLRGFVENANNPHVLGINACEVFFLDDRVVLVEGQDDVVFYRRIAEQLNRKMPGEFFGWGVGGASNMGLVAQMLAELGFTQVVGILDNDKAELKKELESGFPQFNFFVIPAKDVRSKRAVPEKPQVIGLLDEAGRLRSEYSSQVEEMFDRICGVLNAK